MVCRDDDHLGRRPAPSSVRLPGLLLSVLTASSRVRTRRVSRTGLVQTLYFTLSVGAATCTGMALSRRAALTPAVVGPSSIM